MRRRPGGPQRTRRCKLSGPPARVTEERGRRHPRMSGTSGWPCPARRCGARATRRCQQVSRCVAVKGAEEQDAEQRCRPLASPAQAPQAPLRPDWTSPPRPGANSRANMEPTCGQNGHVKNDLERRNPRSVRVRRQGLEPRTRGLRVRCSVRRFLATTCVFIAYQRRYIPYMQAIVPDDDGRYRPVPAHPSEHGASTQPDRSRPLSEKLAVLASRAGQDAEYDS
jgi:hypothetical protein